MTPLLILTLALLLMMAAFVVVLANAYANDRPELHKLRVFVALLAMLAVLGLSGCASQQPKVPERVTVVVERYKPLPVWATDPLPKPMPANGTVGARARSHDARGGVIDVANCHRHLLQKLDRGEPVDEKECAQP